MNEEQLAKDFNQRINSLFENGLFSINEEEEKDKKILLLAQQLTKIDYSKESKIRKSLKEKLMAKIEEKTKTDNGELSDDELDWVAGGVMISEDDNEDKDI